MTKNRSRIFRNYYSISVMCIIALFTIFAFTGKDIYTEESFYGTWVTNVSEPGGEFSIEVTWKSGGACEYVFIYPDGKKYFSSSVWSYKNTMYNETYPDGTKGKAKINWVNKDKFVLVILKNQETKLYKNLERIYERKK